MIALDKNTFEIYEGFNVDKLEPTERFYTERPNDDGEYYVVKLIKTYQLSELPTEDDFLEELEGGEVE